MPPRAPRRSRGAKVSVAAARLYSDAVTAAFVWSEAVRSKVYGDEVAVK
jgi:hypothetical protein